MLYACKTISRTWAGPELGGYEAERRADVVHVERHIDLVARGSCPRDLDHPR